MDAKDTIFYTKKTLTLKGTIVSLETPLVMGVVNLTPDSFYDGGLYSSESVLLKKIETLISEGVDIIDVGGYSTRPGANNVSVQEERTRILKGIKCIVKEFPEIYLSIDTFRSEIAIAAVEAGACMVNDIGGGNLDDAMFETVARLRVPYVLMHMQGTPQTMSDLTSYKDLLLEILSYFQTKTAFLKRLGIKDIIVDPGFGFAKTIDQNYEILKNLSYFRILNLPILIGLSRKSMIYKKLGINAEHALNATSILNTVGLIKGASILRVHDVKEAKEVVKLYKQLYI